MTAVRGEIQAASSTQKDLELRLYLVCRLPT